MGEAALQATVLSLGSEDVREQARAQIETDRNYAPVVVYTYGLSPFSTECKAFLDGIGCKYEALSLDRSGFCSARRRLPCALSSRRRLVSPRCRMCSSKASRWAACTPQTTLAKACPPCKRAASWRRCSRLRARSD